MPVAGYAPIASVDALLALYGEPSSTSLVKEVARLTPAYRRWIEAAPFMAVASVGNGGGLDCSPRGDPAGQLFQVLDDTTIAIPDRRGNNRLDTLRNLISDPRIALLFFVPGIAECVRVNGTAIITSDTGLKARFATIGGKEPATVIVVSIDRVYFQCARAILRSRLWETDARQDPASLPTAGQMTKDGDAAFDQPAYDSILRERQLKTLY